MKILITGVAGFIGSNLAKALLEKGYEVAGLDNLSQGFLMNMAQFQCHPRFTFYENDIRDEKAVEIATGDCDVVVHLAALRAFARIAASMVSSCRSTSRRRPSCPLCSSSVLRTPEVKSEVVFTDRATGLSSAAMWDMGWSSTMPSRMVSMASTSAGFSSRWTWSSATLRP